MKIIGVWGTLKRNECNHRLMVGAKFIGEDLLGGLNDNHTSVTISRNKDGLAKIEVFEISDDLFRKLDELERYYEYTPENVRLESGREVIVWFYKNQKQRNE